MLLFILSVGAINALIPILVIVVLIGAAAGLTRGFSFLDLFAIGTFMGMGPKSGTKASLAKSTYNITMVTTGTSFYPSYAYGKGAKGWLPKFVPLYIRNKIEKKNPEYLVQRRMRIKRDFFNDQYGAVQVAQKEKSNFIKQAVDSASGLAVPGIYIGAVKLGNAGASGLGKTFRRMTGAGYKTVSHGEETALQQRKRILEKLMTNIPEARLFRRKELERAMKYVKSGEAEKDKIHTEFAQKLKELEQKYKDSPMQLRLARMRLDNSYLSKYRDAENATTYNYSVNRVMEKYHRIKWLGSSFEVKSKKNKWEHEKDSFGEEKSQPNTLLAK